MQRQTLIIKLDGDYYGIDVRLIQEVIKNYTLREIPDAPNFVEGIIDLREHIVPLIKIKRLLDSPMFDLYKNKKVVILNFGEGVKVGIVVDEVVGIHYYDDKEIQKIDTVSRSNILQYVIGMIEKDGYKVSILDIFAMFFSNEGSFLHKQFFNKVPSEALNISKQEYFNLKNKIEKMSFPFNETTHHGIVKYVAKIASLRRQSIDQLIKDNSIFQNMHFDLDQKRRFFFENKADMYMISDVLENLIKENHKESLKIWIIGNSGGEDAYSVSMIFNSFEQTRKTIKIINSGDNLDKLIEARRGIYYKNHLAQVPKNLFEKFFDFSESTFSIKPEIKKTVFFDYFKPNPKYHPDGFDFIYAPNYLSKYSSQKETLVKNFFYALNKGGILALGLFENIEGFAKDLKKYYIKNRQVFIREK